LRVVEAIDCMQILSNLDPVPAVPSSESDAEQDFLRLLQVHQNQIFSFIFCQVHHSADAEDLFQQTAVVLWEKFSQYEPGTNFLAWAKAIASNKTLTFLRDRRRSQTRFSDVLIEQLADRGLWSAEANERKLTALAECRQKLSASDQQLVRECYGAAVSQIRAVANQMGRTADSLYVSLSRIRRSLADCIERTLAREELEA